MTKQTEALKLALEALEEIHPGNMTPMAEEAWKKAITALREALTEQPAQQEPVAWIEHEWSGTGLRHLHFEKREPAVRDEVVNPIWTPLYTSPQAQPAQQEPVAWKHDCAALLTNDVELWIPHCPHCGKPRTSPPAQRTWVGLTSDEIAALKTLHGADRERTAIEMAFAVQAKLQEKNT